MARLIKEGAKDQTIRDKAAQLVRGLSVRDSNARNYLAQANAIFQFVRDHVRYLRDIDGMETLHPAPWVLVNRYGDCDDKTVLSMALARAIGFPVRIVAVGYHGQSYSHVFGQFRFGRGWVTMECCENQPLGWTTPGITVRMVRHV